MQVIISVTVFVACFYGYIDSTNFELANDRRKDASIQMYRQYHMSAN